MRIAVTGFGPFGTLTSNPSETVVRALAAGPALADHYLDLAVLPTAYGEASRQVHKLLVTESPDACLLLGVAEGSAELQLETVARNQTVSSAPDVHGEVRAGKDAVTGGPPHYQATLPAERLLTRLTREGLPARLSADAGGYVCDHAFYVACHTAAQYGRPAACGLLHLPGNWPVPRLLWGVRVCLTELVEQMEADRAKDDG